MKTAATTLHLCLCSFDLLIAIQSTTEYLGIIVLVQLQIYLPTSYHRFEKIAPQILHPPRPSPLLASPLPPPQQSFSSLPTKKNSRQVRCTSAPSFLFKWVPILDWSHWTKLDKAERLWRLQPAVQLIYKVPTVCMYVRYVYKERKRKKVTTHKR